MKLFRDKFFKDPFFGHIFFRVKSELHKQGTEKTVIILLMILCVFLVWPFGVLRQEVEQRSGNINHAQTDAMLPGMSMTQSFRAYSGKLKSIDFVIYYDEEQRDGILLFELCDMDDKVLFSEEIPYSDVEDYVYYQVELYIKLKSFHLYQYRLTNVDIEDNLPRIVYTADQKQDARPNRNMIFGGQKSDGNALTRYLWDAPLQFRNGLALIACIGVIGFTLMEIIEFLRPKEKKIEVKKVA